MIVILGSAQVIYRARRAPRCSPGEALEGHFKPEHRIYRYDSFIEGPLIYRYTLLPVPGWILHGEQPPRSADGEAAVQGKVPCDGYPLTFAS